jgi:hypothetical protein
MPRLINFSFAPIFILLALVCCIVTTGSVHAQKTKGGRFVRLLLRDGKVLEGRQTAGHYTVRGGISIPYREVIVPYKRRSGGFTVNGATARSLATVEQVSINVAAEASPSEATRIAAHIAAVQGTDRAARDTAVAALTDIGLPALTPVLNAYKDRDLREPDALYRLFARLMPGYADAADRSLDLIRLKNGDAMRGRMAGESLTIQPSGGAAMTVPLNSIRSLAIRQGVIEKTFEVHSLRHCTQIEFLDTGVIISSNSRVEVVAAGYVRLSFAIDGWASDPDGIKVPGPNYKTNLVDGFPFGALVGKVGVAGTRFVVGRHLDKTGLGEGRLYLAVNDNGHWQNNIGNFRVKLRVSDAYNVGDPQ